MIQKLVHFIIRFLQTFEKRCLFSDYKLSIRQPSLLLRCKLTECFQLDDCLLVCFNMFNRCDKTVVSRITVVLSTRNSQYRSLRTTSSVIKFTIFKSESTLTRRNSCIIRSCPFNVIKFLRQTVNNARNGCFCTSELFFVNNTYP